MSTTDGSSSGEVCASCGISAVDDVKLEECDGCELVKYCSDECQEKHREQHEEACKERTAELHDKRLFTQSERAHREDCPICFLPMPLNPNEYSFQACCSSVICNGCIHANMMSNKHDRVKAMSCAFCRTPFLDDEYTKREMERVNANDPAALCHMGENCFKEDDYDSALEYLTKAVELGDIDAHCKLAEMYSKGGGVEKDEEKEVYHYEKAAIGGHPYARYNLAAIEKDNGNMKRAVKHHIIAANLGLEESMKALWKHYSAGHIAKEDLDATLRTHQAAIDAMKSAQRDAAEIFFKE